MGFEVLIESLGVEDRFIGMIDKLKVAVPKIPPELTQWETEALGRQKTNTEETRAGARAWVYPFTYEQKAVVRALRREEKRAARAKATAIRRAERRALRSKRRKRKMVFRRKVVASKRKRTGKVTRVTGPFKPSPLLLPQLALRPELYQQLRDRMTTMMQREFKW